MAMISSMMRLRVDGTERFNVTECNRIGLVILAAPLETAFHRTLRCRVRGNSSTPSGWQRSTPAVRYRSMWRDRGADDVGGRLELQGETQPGSKAYPNRFRVDYAVSARRQPPHGQVDRLDGARQDDQ